MPSAKEDLPEPLRPTTSVRPGCAFRCRVASGPMPRKPWTVTFRSHASFGPTRAATTAEPGAGAGGASASKARARASGPSSAPKRRVAAFPPRGTFSSRSNRSPSSTSSTPRSVRRIAAAWSGCHTGARE